MTFPRKIVLVRHGQSEANVVQKGLHPAPEGFHRAADVNRRLTKQGINQAKIAGEWLKDQNYTFGRHYSSPFLRAMETAVHLNVSDKWIIDDLWRERDWGEYGLYSKEDQEKLFQDSTALKTSFAWYWKPTGGESLSTGVRSRVNSIITHLSRLEETDAILGVTHGEFASTFQFVMEKMTPHEWVEREINPAYTIRNTNILEYSRVNPNNPTDIRSFYKWGRVTNPWDETLSHNKGEWYELESKTHTMEDMNELIQAQKPWLSDYNGN